MDVFEETLNLSSLKDSLLTIDPSNNDKNSQKKSSLNSPPSLSVVKTITARKNVAMKEIPRFYEILQHSTFKINPLSTIRTHIENTIEKKKKELMDVD
ncbi:2735_t:CDS:2 [Diversispora eburnea]|uniref:Ribosome biogenesis protein SLX9 n=1 Tax=Diversispora eburnea TaxID=1213867 RepID=A0A9N8ZR81_9GLOM|nr:2735_t:CDS:2 [Diversispora eburnea]